MITPQYLIIGSGRVAEHFKYYFSLLAIVFDCWSRKDSIQTLPQKLDQATHVLILISDAAIESFIVDSLQGAKACLIHFSGSLLSERAYGAHPFMTFSTQLYTLDQYKAIPFVIDHDAPLFEALLPGLPNSSVRLHKSLKPKYHALCVLSGNFSCLLWQKLLLTLESEFNFPVSVAFPYLSQQTENLMSDFKTALTGPLVRGDDVTLEKNLEALEGDCFQALYQSFISCYQKLAEKG